MKGKEPHECNCGCPKSLAFDRVILALSELEPKEQQAVLTSAAKFLDLRQYKGSYEKSSTPHGNLDPDSDSDSESDSGSDSGSDSESDIDITPVDSDADEYVGTAVGVSRRSARSMKSHRSNDIDTLKKNEEQTETEPAKMEDVVDFDIEDVPHKISEELQQMLESINDYSSNSTELEIE